MTLWVSEQLLNAMHDEQLAEHGGASGIRDPGLLESALARPVNRAGYGDPDIVELGALYAIAIARNHPFVDGNKRAGFMAMVYFLATNGAPLVATEAEAVVAMLDMASGELTDDEFILWVREHSGTAD
jgi:death-on-curing protein